MQHVVRKDTVIASGASLSSQTTGTHGLPGGGIDAAGLALCAVRLPAGWTAAVVTFAVSMDGTTFDPVYNPDGTEFQLAEPAGNPVPRFVPLAPFIDTFGWRFIKVRSGTSGAPVNQAADRTVSLLFREQRG